MFCFYCRKRAVRRGTCVQTSVGKIEVCGRHFHRIERPNENIGTPRRRPDELGVNFS